MPLQPYLTPKGGGGGGDRFSMTYWCYPLPPAGPMTIHADWPDQSFEEVAIPFDADQHPRSGAATRSRCGSRTRSRDPLHARRAGLVDHDVLVRDHPQRVPARRGRAARPAAAGSRGSSDGRTARCPPRTSRTATNRRARRASTSVVEDRAPQVVGHDDRRARSRPRRGSARRPRGRTPPARRRRRRAGRRRPRGRGRRATTVVPAVREPPRVASAAARHVAHRRRRVSTDAPKRSIHGDDGFIGR